MESFKVSDNLELRLEDDETNIYVNGELFSQCKYLLFEIPINDSEDYNGLNSIDEISDYADDRGHQMEYDHSIIPPETEFWGHCSNLQAWYESGYDTNLLHSNLSFPLLKKLSEDDPLAKQKFNEELIDRLNSGYAPTIAYLIKQGYPKSLTKDELTLLDFDQIHNSLLKEGFFNESDKLSELIGIKLLLEEKVIQSIYETILKQGEVCEAYKLHNLTGIKPSNEAVQLGHERLFKENDICFADLLVELSGIKPNAEIVQSYYERVFEKGWFSKLRWVSSLTGIEPSNEMVQSKYEELFKQRSMNGAYEFFYHIRVKPSNEIIQSKYKELFKQRCIMGAEILYKKIGIKPSNETVQSGYETLLKSGWMIGWARELFEFTGIKPKEEIIHSSFEKLIREGWESEAQELIELTEMIKATT